MNFTYRGIAFEAPIAGRDAIATEQTGTFRGKTYQMKQACVAQHQSDTELTYRGVRYAR